jgi:serine/threonine protein kinase
LDERTAKQMIREVLKAVSYLHSRDPPIIHRDIKPENILLDKNNKVKLAGTLAIDSDFGWSNFLNKPRKTYCGTFDYLAPEMIDKSGHD